jgi:hypothetical protein
MRNDKSEINIQSKEARILNCFAWLPICVIKQAVKKPNKEVFSHQLAFWSINEYWFFAFF